MRAVPEVGDYGGGRFSPVEPGGYVLGRFEQEFGDSGEGEGGVGCKVEGCGCAGDGEGDFGVSGGGEGVVGVEGECGGLGFGVVVRGGVGG